MTPQDNAPPPAPPQEPPPPLFGNRAQRRNVPLLCVHSANLAKVPYFQLGDIAAQMGFEGVDLTVMIGGHVDPRITNVDLVRALEATRGAGLEVPMISTTLAGPGDPTTFPVLYLTGRSQVPLFRTGYWQWGKNIPIQQRLVQVRQDFLQLLAVAQRCNIAAAVPNRAGGFVGQSVWDMHAIIGTTNPAQAGYCYDPAEATIEGGLGGWESGLRIALPRLKAISLQDFYWSKSGDGWQVTRCPLGQGMVDWDKFLGLVAGSGFTGPISLYLGYNPQDPVGAMNRDLEFARAAVGKFWKPGGAPR